MDTNPDKVLAKIVQLYALPRAFKKPIDSIRVDTLALALHIRQPELMQLLSTLEDDGKIVLNKFNYSERAKNKNSIYGTVALIKNDAL